MPSCSGGLGLYSTVVGWEAPTGSCSQAAITSLFLRWGPRAVEVPHHACRCGLGQPAHPVGVGHRHSSTARCAACCCTTSGLCSTGAGSSCRQASHAHSAAAAASAAAAGPTLGYITIAYIFDWGTLHFSSRLGVMNWLSHVVNAIAGAAALAWLVSALW